jgi:hypothetical protein
MNYVNKNDVIYSVKTITTPTQTATEEILIGTEICTEQIKDEQGNVIETITKKFNINTGEYEVIASE